MSRRAKTIASVNVGTIWWHCTYLFNLCYERQPWMSSYLLQKFMIHKSQKTLNKSVFFLTFNDPSRGEFGGGGVRALPCETWDEGKNPTIILHCGNLRTFFFKHNWFNCVNHEFVTKKDWGSLIPWLETGLVNRHLSLVPTGCYNYWGVECEPPHFLVRALGKKFNPHLASFYYICI